MAKKFTAYQLKQMQVALAGARELIRNDKEEFICCALYETSCEFTGDYLRQWIMKQISPKTSYYSWLQSQLPAERTLHSREAREGRIQWINWMINELAKEERELRAKRPAKIAVNETKFVLAA